MACGEDHHRSFIGVIVRDHLIHVEEVAVAIAHDIFAKTVYRILEVEVNGVACTYAKACVAALLGCTAGDVTGAEVTEGGIAAFEIEVAVLVGDIGRLLLAGADSLGVFFLLGTQMRPSLRSDSLMSVSFDWSSPWTGIQVG